MMLLEICCKCGFVHKSDQIQVGGVPYRGYKPHYHWHPVGGALEKDGVKLHATICVACCGEVVNWKEFYEYKAKTPEKYRVKWSLNAPLPEHYLEYAGSLYAEQAKYYEFE
jgi:hypothetical protein